MLGSHLHCTCSIAWSGLSLRESAKHNNRPSHWIPGRERSVHPVNIFVQLTGSLLKYVLLKCLAFSSHIFPSKWLLPFPADNTSTDCTSDITMICPTPNQAELFKKYRTDFPSNQTDFPFQLNRPSNQTKPTFLSNRTDCFQTKPFPMDLGNRSKVKVCTNQDAHTYVISTAMQSKLNLLANCFQPTSNKLHTVFFRHKTRQREVHRQDKTAKSRQRVFYSTSWKPLNETRMMSVHISTSFLRTQS